MSVDIITSLLHKNITEGLVESLLKENRVRLGELLIMFVLPPIITRSASHISSDSISLVLSIVILELLILTVP